MGEVTKEKDDIALYIKDQEYIANNYVMKCFTVTMWVYTTAFVLNLLDIFVVQQDLMFKGYVPSMVIYIASVIVSKCMSPSNKIKKYIILSGSIYVFTIAGVFITYHAILVTLLPFLYATLYSSKRVLRFVYIMTTLSTVIIVYCGYFFGLCDANMALLTSGSLAQHSQDGVFILTEVNPNPWLTLMLFFVLPRCLIYIACMSVCSSCTCGITCSCGCSFTCSGACAVVRSLRRAIAGCQAYADSRCEYNGQKFNLFIHVVLLSEK